MQMRGAMHLLPSISPCPCLPLCLPLPQMQWFYFTLRNVHPAAVVGTSHATSIDADPSDDIVDSSGNGSTGSGTSDERAHCVHKRQGVSALAFSDENSGACPGDAACTADATPTSAPVAGTISSAAPDRQPGACAHSPVTMTFNIINLTKPDSLFNSGMRPVMYSHHEVSHWRLREAHMSTDMPC